MKHTLNWLAAAAIAFALASTWDAPTDLEATEAVASEVAALTGGCK